MSHRHDRLIDPSLKYVNHLGFKRLVAELFKGMDKPPQKTYRQRQRDTLRVVLANLHHESRSGGWLAYHKDRRGPEYQHPGYRFFSAEYMKKVAAFLIKESYVLCGNGYFSKKSPKDCKPASMRAAPRLLEKFERAKLNSVTAICAPRSELVVLRKGGERVEYKPTDFTIVAERQLKELNRLYGEHQLRFEDREIVKRYIHRVFCNDFDHGGRIYGAEWLLRCAQDRLGITIDGMPVAELDYSSFHPTILYALIGEPFNDDLYRVSGYPDDKDARKFIKQATLTRINSRDGITAARSLQGEMNKWVKRKDTGLWEKKLKRPSWLDSPNRLIKAIEDRHGPINHLFDGNTGQRLQKLDSEICTEILQYFFEQGIPVLSVHDSFVVPAKHKDELRQVMEGVFNNKYGVLCKIDEKFKKTYKNINI